MSRFEQKYFWKRTYLCRVSLIHLTLCFLWTKLNL